MRARLSFHFPLFFALAAVGCSAPRSALVNLWVDPRHPSEPMGHLLVVALWQDPDARSLWEERFAEVLEKSDADVTTSYLELSHPMPDSAAVFKEASRKRCDGVIVIHEHVMERDTFYIPGYSMPMATKTPRWYRFRGGAEVWMDESVGSRWPALQCDVELWSLGDRTGMVWSGTTDVVDPGDDQHAAYEVANTVVSELSRLGLVPSGL